MLFTHKCHGGTLRAFRFGVHKTPAWFFEALENGSIKRCSGITSSIANITKVDSVFGNRIIYNEDWVLYHEHFGLYAAVSQEDFQNNFERINDPSDPQIQSNVDEAVTNVGNATNLAVDLNTVSNLITKEFARLESENAELRQRAENNNTCYISEAAWAERVGKYLIDFDRNGYSMLSRCMMIYIPEEHYKTLLEEYKALGHSLER